MRSKLRISLPAIFFVGFLFLANTIMGLYGGLSMQRSAAFQLIYALIFWAALSWWFLDDSKNHGWEWLHSWGIFLYAAGWLILPYYLFKTRGVKTLLTILFFVVLYFWTQILGLIVSAVFSVLVRH